MSRLIHLWWLHLLKQSIILYCEFTSTDWDSDKDTYTITSSQFGFNKKVYIIKNKLGSNVLQVLDMDNNVLVPNIGTYDSAKGTINITSFYTDELFAIIKLTAVPANPSTLRPLRNHIFELTQHFPQ